MAKTAAATKSSLFLLLASLLCSTNPLAAAEGESAVLPPSLVYADRNRQPYALTLLSRALDAAGSPHELVPNKSLYEQGQSLKILANNRGIDISWSMTSITREEMLLPIRIPIFKGLIGWRLPLVKTLNKELFSGVNNLRQLQQFTCI